MNCRLTEKMDRVKNSMIRTIGVIAEENVKPGDKMIKFSAGFPAPAALPVDLVKKYSEEVLNDYGVDILQYGLDQSGYKPLKEEIRKFVNKDGDIIKDEDDMVITYGSSEAISLVTSAFIDPGDKVIVEDPTYMNATNVFTLYGAEVVGVPMEEDGVNIEKLEEAMKAGAKFYYTIPTFGNPSTITMSQEKRKAVYELAVKYGVPILEDNPYGYLRFSGEALLPIKSLDTEGAVMYMGTMSKIISPGMRVGYVCANKELIAKLAKLKANVTNGNVNWSQYVITKILKEVDMDEHIKRISAIYEKKAMVMYDKMKECFHPSVKIIKPEGGMFIWVELPEGVKALPFCEEAARELHIPIVPGNDFCINNQNECTGMRFNFSLPTEEEIATGIEQVGKLTYKYCEK